MTPKHCHAGKPAPVLKKYREFYDKANYEPNERSNIFSKINLKKVQINLH